MTRIYFWFGTLLPAFVLSCGESADSDGGMGDGSEDVVGECPDIAPHGMPVEPCPENLPPEGCTYTLECASGPHDFTFACMGRNWFVEPSPCERPSEFCTGGEKQVRCDEGPEGELVWGTFFSGYDGPAPCPTETPHDGDPCTDYLFAQLSCGYFCDDGTTWTTGYCDNGATESTWVFDGACD